ncbi:MAG: hypothetical protein UHD09_02730 [Bifidobacterium sp.]|nr:hypothetical protein [Bifidobacterium sp.]
MTTVSVNIAEAREVLAGARRVLIGAGAGLSTAAGLRYGGERFRKHMAAFIDRYGMTDMYSAGFYPFADDADRWAYWAHHATVNNLAQPVLPLYEELFDWAKGRDYFVITTNADGQFPKAGFDPARVFMPQGDYAHIQCAGGCDGKVYDARDVFAKIEEDTDHGRRTRISDPSLIPTCPTCGGPMRMHLRVDSNFVQDDDWYAAQQRYFDFAQGIADEPTVLLELGVGWNTPTWIRMPFERVAAVTDSTLIRMNYDDATIPPKVHRGISIPGDLSATLPEVL